MTGTDGKSFRGQNQDDSTNEPRRLLTWPWEQVSTFMVDAAAEVEAWAAAVVPELEAAVQAEAQAVAEELELKRQCPLYCWSEYSNHISKYEMYEAVWDCTNQEEWVNRFFGCKGRRTTNTHFPLGSNFHALCEEACWHCLAYGHY
eukprot:CAMPEP_0170823384 /NCGR_PEP_ID=MMETSP0733-20121128/44530_1 /TAXON_ID=186038 /ORGANISM="Fragilariopsis kerguelensis, Strain L26-C5" /LENGTH=145 /DNA_ID=CAMNT_0011186139 /DNA_START=154 /DNA_END=591 /DNA_ORIENTATION=+